MLKELEKKQECEREFLEKLLQEEQTSERRKKAQKQSKETRNERLTELKVRFFIHSEAQSRIEPGGARIYGCMPPSNYRVYKASETCW